MLKLAVGQSILIDITPINEKCIKFTVILNGNTIIVEGAGQADIVKSSIISAVNEYLKEREES